METTIVSKNAIAVSAPPELLGPQSVYELRRLELRKEYGAVLVSAKNITITSPESLEEAVNHGRLLQVAVKEVEDFYKVIKQQIDNIKKPILESEKKDVGEYNTEKDRLGREVTKYRAEQRRIQEEEERKARKEAEDAAREAQLARAIELEELGDTETAAAVLEEPVYTPPVILQNTAPAKIAGSVGKKNYKAKLADLMTLVKAVANGQAPLQALEWNESFCCQQARSFREGYSIPGTVLEVTESTSFRA